VGKAIGARIESERERLGFTQEELGQRLGVDRKTVNRWENGRSPDAENLAKLAVLLGRSADYLLGLEEQRDSAERKAGVREGMAIAAEAVRELAATLDASDVGATLRAFRAAVAAKPGELGPRDRPAKAQ